MALILRIGKNVRHCDDIQCDEKGFLELKTALDYGVCYASSFV